MKTLAALVFVLLIAAEVHAHVGDMPAIVHLVDHGWMGLAFATLLLLPRLRWRR